MDRLISEQEVFDAISAWIALGEYDYTNATEYLRKRIKAIPSAEPKGDLVSRQAVIEAIDVWDSYAETMERIKNLPSAEPKWILVSERLPETDDDVLVTADDGGIYLGFIYKYGSKSWYIVGEEYHEPIAWMPLPSPYSEGSDKE